MVLNGVNLGIQSSLSLSLSESSTKLGAFWSQDTFHLESTEQNSESS